MEKREIKFRGKSLETHKNGEWVYGSYHFTKGKASIRWRKYEAPYYEDKDCDIDYHIILIPRLPGEVGWNTQDTYSAYKIDPATLGQYTGLKDKNDKEIYEGDVVQTKLGETMKVFFNTSMGSWDVEFSGGDCDKLIGEYGWDSELEEYELEVIGNIYENPGLLNN